MKKKKKKQKSRNRKQKPDKKKLKAIDYILYCLLFIFTFLFSFGMLYVVSFLRKCIFLSNPEVLAFSNRSGIFWSIPSALIGAVPHVYLYWAASKEMPIKEVFAFVFHKKKVALITALCFVIYSGCLGLAVFSSRDEIRTDGFYDCGIFEEKKTGEITSAQKVEWNFEKTLFSIGGRQASHRWSTDLYCIITINDQKIYFEDFDIPQLLSMIHTLKGIPTEIVDEEELSEKWIENLECEEETKEELYKLFILHQN